MSKLQLNRIGYVSNVNGMSVQYANGSKNKPVDFSYDKLMDMDAMQAFLDEKNTALTEEMNQKFGDIFESVGYEVRVLPNGLSPQLQMVTKNVLSANIKEQCEEYLEYYQKKFAKNFNKQPFTRTEYGFAKFPSTNRFGIDLLHDDELVKNQKISITGSEEDKYKEIIAAPGFTGNCHYHFTFDKDKWPTINCTGMYYTKDGSMRESKDPLMAGVKAILEKQGQLDLVDEITIYDDQHIIINMPPVDDSTIISIANEVGDYVMNIKFEQDGKELEAALDMMPENTGIEMK